MITPDELRPKVSQALERKWTALLLDDLRGGFERWRFRVGVDRKTAMGDFSAFEACERAWREAERSCGVELSTRPASWRCAGGARDIIDRASFLSADSMLRFLGSKETTARWKRSAARLREAARLLPAGCAETLAREAKILEDPDETPFRRLLGVVLHLKDHPKADCFVRELPVPGLDTKWLEANEGRVCRLLSAALGEEVSPGTLFSRWGLKKPPFFVTIRHAQAFVPGLFPKTPAALPLEALSAAPKALSSSRTCRPGSRRRASPTMSRSSWALGLALQGSPPFPGSALSQSSTSATLTATAS